MPSGATKESIEGTKRYREKQKEIKKAESDEYMKKYRKSEMKHFIMVAKLNLEKLYNAFTNSEDYKEAVSDYELGDSETAIYIWRCSYDLSKLLTDPSSPLFDENYSKKYYGK